MEKLKRAVIKEELYALTGNTIRALILNQLLYWSERVYSFDKFIEEEKYRIAHKAGPDVPPIEIELTNGWIYKSADDLKEECMIDDSRATVARRLQELIDAGIIMRRNNPKFKYDRTYQYRVDLVKLNYELYKIGYQLQGYKFDIANVQIEKSSAHSEQSNLQGEDLILQGEYLILQGEGAIPETTTETKTTEIKKDIYISNPQTENKTIKSKKIKYAEYVSMTEEEYNKLVKKHGEALTKKLIEDLDNWKGAKPNKRTYENDYRAILSWVVEKVINEHPQTVNKNTKPITHKNGFNNYDQRSYDIKDLERKLLGLNEEE